MLARDKELDILFEHPYEDSVAGKISDERFHRMSCRYEDEQAELKAKIKVLQKEVEQSEIGDVSTDMFISTVRKYTCAKKLTPRMLNELVHRIEAYHTCIQYEFHFIFSPSISLENGWTMAGSNCAPEHSFISISASLAPKAFRYDLAQVIAS